MYRQAHKCEASQKSSVFHMPFNGISYHCCAGVALSLVATNACYHRQLGHCRSCTLVIPPPHRRCNVQRVDSRPRYRTTHHAQRDVAKRLQGMNVPTWTCALARTSQRRPQTLKTQAWSRCCKNISLAYGLALNRLCMPSDASFCMPGAISGVRQGNVMMYRDDLVG